MVKRREERRGQDWLGPELGAGVPDEVREAGAGDAYARALEISRPDVIFHLAAQSFVPSSWNEAPAIRLPYRPTS